MIKQDKGKVKNWADEEEEDLDENETKLDSSGVRERVKISVNTKGQKVKTILKVRVKEVKSKTPLRTFGRKNLPRFGEAKLGEQNVTLLSPDFVSIEHPDDQLMEDADDPTLTKTLANFISKQAERGLARELDMEEEEKDTLDVDVVFKREDGKYVAPTGRGGASGKDAGFGDKDGTENTLRVSNLTKSVTEEDLRDLFERFGKVHRISLPKMERFEGANVIKEPRGFAYIAFARKEDAEMAMARLDGYGYDHLIIKVEWAKQNKEGGSGSGSGVPSQYMSGYGKQLAQDTTEKVYYASNLTGNR